MYSSKFPFTKIPSLRASALFLSALAVPVSNAHATTMTWSTYGGWSSNVTSPIELNFNSISAVGGNYSTASGKTLLPVSGTALPFVFTGPITAGGYQLSGAQYGLGNTISLAGPASGSGSINIALPNDGVNAFLLGLGSTGLATSINVSLSDGETFSVAALPNFTELFGVSISHKVTSITVSASSQAYIDDFYFANSKLTQDIANPPQAPAEAAEGSTLALMTIGGFLAVAGIRRTMFSAPQAA